MNPELNQTGVEFLLLLGERQCVPDRVTFEFCERQYQRQYRIWSVCSRQRALEHVKQRFRLWLK